MDLFLNKGDFVYLFMDRSSGQISKSNRYYPHFLLNSKMREIFAKNDILQKMEDNCLLICYYDDYYTFFNFHTDYFFLKRNSIVHKKFNFRSEFLSRMSCENVTRSSEESVAWCLESFDKFNFDDFENEFLSIFDLIINSKVGLNKNDNNYNIILIVKKLHILRENDVYNFFFTLNDCFFCSSVSSVDCIRNDSVCNFPHTHCLTRKCYKLIVIYLRMYNENLDIAYEVPILKAIVWLESVPRENFRFPQNIRSPNFFCSDGFWFEKNTVSYLCNHEQHLNPLDLSLCNNRPKDRFTLYCNSLYFEKLNIFAFENSIHIVRNKNLIRAHPLFMFRKICDSVRIIEKFFKVRFLYSY